MLYKAKLVGEELCQGRDDCKSGGVFYILFLAAKIKICLTVNKFGMLQEHKTFKGFNISRRLLDRSQYFEMIEGKRKICYLKVGKIV